MANVLVVDDVTSELRLITRILQDAGHAVTTASNGEDALAQVAKAQPGLIILDVVMPGRTGFDVCRAIKKDPATASIPVILLTSKAQESDKFWGLRQGAAEYLTKPFEEPVLLAAIKKHAR